jgi:hypothetical protein
MADIIRAGPRAVWKRTVACLWAGLAIWAAACGDSPAAPSSQPAACTPAPGLTCFGRNNYVEYAAGDFPVVVSVPHGGALVPASIPDRTSGTTVTDTNTIELGRAVAQAFSRAPDARCIL